MKLVAAALLAITAACAPSTRPLVDGTGLHLDDADTHGSGFSYRDLSDAVFFATPDGRTESVAVHTSSSQFAGGALTIGFGLDAPQSIARTMKARLHDGTVHDVDVRGIDTTTLDGPPDGSALSLEAAGDADGVVDVALVRANGARTLFVDAEKAKERWSATGDVLVVGAKLTDAVGATTRTVTAYDDAGDHVLCADACAREVAVTSDGARALFFGDDSNDVGTLEIVDVAGGTPALLSGPASDQALKLDETDATGARAYFLGADASLRSIQSIALDGTGARTLPATGAVDIVDVRNGFVVYASAIDATTSVASLGIAHDGGDVALGTRALAEGFSSDGRFYVFRDRVAFDAKGHAFGRLRSFDTSTAATRTIADDVRKAQIAGDVVVWLDETKHLKRARLDRGAPELVQIDVDTFDVMGRDTKTPHLVYSIPADVNAGIWLTDP